MLSRSLLGDALCRVHGVFVSLTFQILQIRIKKCYHGSNPNYLPRPLFLVMRRNCVIKIRNCHVSSAISMILNTYWKKTETKPQAETNIADERIIILRLVKLSTNKCFSFLMYMIINKLLHIYI